MDSTTHETFRIASLGIKDMPPFDAIEVSFGSRWNVLTGDNGLGKTLLLDVIWHLLTGAKSRKYFLPSATRDAKVSCSFALDDDKISCAENDFSTLHQGWNTDSESKSIAGYKHYALYLSTDGSFSVYGGSHNETFTSDEVWNGKVDVSSEKERTVCNGLVSDLAYWKSLKNKKRYIDALNGVLEKLSPPDSEPIFVDEPERIDINDARLIPHIRFSYGTVPVTHAPAALKRILSLAYMVVWLWSERNDFERLSGGQKPINSFVVLVDEIEAHLHPKWQRRILPSLQEAISTLDMCSTIQTFVSTYSPLILTSLEPFFETGRDCVLGFDESDGNITVKQLAWTTRGDANAWLTSEAFDLSTPRSLEAETVLKSVSQRLMSEDLSANLMHEIRTQLSPLLNEFDPLWMRLRALARSEGIEA